MFKEITGYIEHRILLNYRIDPEVAHAALPEGMSPILVKGYAYGGICQLSLSQMRPKGFPAFFGTSSHNAAHRIAVEYKGIEGVYVPHRHTSSHANRISGGIVFPGRYGKACFNLSSNHDGFDILIESKGKEKLVLFQGNKAERLPESSLFDSIETASTFFQRGNTGWSHSRNENTFDTIRLSTQTWNMQALDIKREHSSFFSDLSLFPKGSVTPDCALLMQGIPHSWLNEGCPYC